MLRLLIFIFLLLPLSNNAFAKNSNYKYCNYHKFLFFKLEIYDLYLCYNDPDKLSYPKIYESEFVIHIKYNKNISKTSLVERSIKEIKKYHVISANEKIDYTKQLDNIFPNVKKGDVIEAKYLEGKTHFFYNKNKVGIIDDQKFSKRFLDIWLHPDNDYANVNKDLYKKPE